MKRTRALSSVALLSTLAILAVSAVALSAPAPADLEVSVLPSRPDVYVHRRLVYSVIVKNTGGTDATNIGVSFGLSTGVELGAASSSRAACAPVSPVDCVIGVLERGRAAKIRISLRPNGSGPLIATASAGLAEPELELGNNEASSATQVRPGRIGPPKLIVRHKPAGPLQGLTATVTGELYVHEPGTLTWRLKNTLTGASLVMHAGSTINGHAYSSASTVFASGLNSDGVLPFTFRFTAAPQKIDHSYAVVVHAVDLEGQTSDITIPVKLAGS